VFSRAKAAFCIGVSMLEISAVGTLKNKFGMKKILELASNIKAACTHKFSVYYFIKKAINNVVNRQRNTVRVINRHRSYNFGFV
jgi:hypothetical protein